MTRWQYRIEEFDSLEAAKEKVDSWGLRGWEAIGFEPILNDVPLQLPNGAFATTKTATYLVVAKKPMEDDEPSAPSPPTPTDKK